jgi:cytochrome c-type biogenesis protein
VDLVSITYPFTAGIFVLLSPCGYALIPGYISYYLGSDLSVQRALKGGLISTLGLVSVYGFIGLGAQFLGSLIRPYITTFILFSAIVLFFLGFLILANVNLPYLFSINPSNKRGITGFFIFGVAYGLAAAGCTAPIFFSILLLAVMGEGALGGVLTFAFYAIGVGLPLIVTGILVALAKNTIIDKIRNLTPKLHKISGIVMILVGIYLIYIYLTWLA